MKKEYMKPSMKAHKIQPVSIICGSGDRNATLGGGSGGDEQPQAEDHTYSTTTYTGIWGE